MSLVRASRWLQSRLTPSPLRSHRLPSKRSPKRLPLKPFGRLSGRSLGLAAALVATTGLSAVAVAQPMAVAAERGDLALVPYYTVRGQWVTGSHIVNTSEHTQVVKFRFRRATDGMDALDFNIVMSPHDVYAGFLHRDNQNGKISWSSPDTTCTVPATQANRLTLPPIYRVGAESGYVEIIAMGQPQDEQQPIAVAAKHRATTSMPLDCAAVRSNFFADGRAANTSATPAVAGKRGVLSNNQTFQPGVASASNTTIKDGGTNTYTDSGNVLKVSYFIRDNATGIEFGDNAVHIADFLGLPSITNQEYGTGSGDLNGFDFPDLDGTGLPGTGTATGANPTIVRNRFNLLRRIDVLGAASILNEWSANPANGVQMDWVVTLPGQYTMLRLPQYLQSLGADRAWVPTVSSAGRPLENPQCPRTAIPATGTAARVPACDFRDLPLDLEYVAYNREEFKGEAATGTLAVSPQAPAAPASTYLPKVANVITFGGNSVLGQSDANVNASLGQPFGWLEAQLKPRRNSNPHVCAWDSAQDGASSSTSTRPLGTTAGQALTMDCTSVATGKAPVIGFAAWSRQVAANPDASYGRIVEHSYGPVPGTVFRDALKDGGQGPQMVVLPTGSFQMGSPATEIGRFRNEEPVHTVTISKRIAMGRYEVTFAEYDRFADADSSRSRPADQGWGRGSQPVINVSQEDAQAYATWLSAQTGQRYRLPSESEWEYAARAGTRTRYSWGDGINCGQARYGRRAGGDGGDGGECSKSQDGTSPVGSFAANAFGLFDMHGNVGEWMKDCYHSNYQGAPTDGSAWTNRCVSTSVVVRGSSWVSSPRILRAAFRNWFAPSDRSIYNGFRLVQDLNP